MKTELIHGSHSVGESNLHLQFTPAYRQDVFANKIVRELTIAYLLLRAKQLKVFISAIDCGPDHIHLFIENWKNKSIVALARELKSFVSRKLRSGHNNLIEDKLWGNKFWSSGYFYRTVGVVTKETVKKYVAESQQKHWEKKTINEQKTLLNYVG